MYSIYFSPFFGILTTLKSQSVAVGPTDYLDRLFNARARGSEGAREAWRRQKATEWRGRLCLPGIFVGRGGRGGRDNE